MAGKKCKGVKEGAEEHRVSMQDFYDSFVEMQRRQTSWESKVETMLRKLEKLDKLDNFDKRIKLLEQKVVAAVELDQRIDALEVFRIPNLEARLLKLEEKDVAEGVKEKMEAAWSEVVAKKRPGVLPMGSIIHEQMHQQRLTDDRKANIIVYGLKADDKVPDKGLFMSIVRASNMGNDIKDKDVECLRLGKPAEGTVQPLRVVLSDAEMKLKLFKNLKHWREKLHAENGQDTVLPSLEHDLTHEQRAEKKTLLADARSKQGKLPADSLFRIRVRGPPERMRIVKIDKQGKWVQLDM